jgi:hypothetical protein
LHTPSTVNGQSPTIPECDRCPRAMEPSGWIPKPNGHGGLRRLTVFRCTDCSRVFDEVWGYREMSSAR